MIKVCNISKRYGDHYAVKDLSFEIEKGTVYGFLGPNGAGKSTTMNIMTGYIAATEGTVSVNDLDIAKNAFAAKKCIGYLPEQPPLYQDMTIKEYLNFVADLKKINKSERAKQIEDVMDKTFIKSMSNRLIRNLSKGYKQRVGLAQAMLGNPEVIILDEPTVGLDPKQIIEIRELIKELKKEHTVILSSHILSEVAEVCDKFMIIARGRMVASGTEEELLEELGASNIVELQVSGDTNSFVSVLDSIDDIEKYDYSVCDETSRIECKIIVKKGLDIQKELCRKLVDADFAIYKLIAGNKTLEDIFLEVTDDKYLDEFEAENSDNAEESVEETNEEASEETVNESSDENTEESAEENAEVPKEEE